jgi:hypothetical protein
MLSVVSVGDKLWWTEVSAINKALKIIASEEGLKLCNPGQIIWSFKLE